MPSKKIAQTRRMFGACSRSIRMDVVIRPVRDGDVHDLVELAALAWEPVFRSFEQVLGPNIYALLYPDWRKRQQDAIERVCADGEMNVWVADVGGVVAGFIVYELNQLDREGKVELLAVHPDHQNRGIGTELNTFALGKMGESGIRLAVLTTGGDPGHTPARRSYEKAGYTPLPLVRYYQDLCRDSTLPV
jgi:ribosomal protein S18 acetylase RimI-like enzyme